MTVEVGTASLIIIAVILWEVCDSYSCNMKLWLMRFSGPAVGMSSSTRRHDRHSTQSFWLPTTYLRQVCTCTAHVHIPLTKMIWPFGRSAKCAATGHISHEFMFGLPWAWPHVIPKSPMFCVITEWQSAFSFSAYSNVLIIDKAFLK